MEVVAGAHEEQKTNDKYKTMGTYMRFPEELNLARSTIISFVSYLI